MTSSPTETTDRRLRVAIVGCGGIAHQHAKAYAESGRTQLVGLVDVLPDHAEAYADLYGGPTFPDVSSLMSEAGRTWSASPPRPAPTPRSPRRCSGPADRC